jgi:hypothetical protein
MKAENIIRTLWLARASAQRTPQEAEMLADEAWSLGLHSIVHPMCITSMLGIWQDGRS